MNSLWGESKRADVQTYLVKISRCISLQQKLLPWWQPRKTTAAYGEKEKRRDYAADYGSGQPNAGISNH